MYESIQLLIQPGLKNVPPNTKNERVAVYGVLTKSPTLGFDTSAARVQSQVSHELNEKRHFKYGY